MRPLSTFFMSDRVVAHNMLIDADFDEDGGESLETLSRQVAVVGCLSTALTVGTTRATGGGGRR